MTRAKPPGSRVGRGPGQLRIVGGLYRGRRLPIPDWPGLRPTPDRIRETLFNWLAPVLPGARCLDPFAGSGALGLEAASRGASRVLMLERAAPVARGLRDACRALVADPVEVVEADALRWLDRPATERFDLVFLDPPYGDKLLPSACTLLAERGWLAPEARIYLECPSRDPLPALPQCWDILRERAAGEVRYALALVGAA